VYVSMTNKAIRHYNVTNVTWVYVSMTNKVIRQCDVTNDTVL
jgi:hypothetical protein